MGRANARRVRMCYATAHLGVLLLVAVDLPGGGIRRPQSSGTIVGSHPPLGGLCTTFFGAPSPYSRSSSFCCFLLRQPLPAEIGGGTIIGISASRTIRNPAADSGDTADASCTGDCEAGSSPTTAGGAVSLPTVTPTPSAAVGAADPTALSALAKLDRRRSQGRLSLRQALAEVAAYRLNPLGGRQLRPHTEEVDGKSGRDELVSPGVAS